MSPDNEILQPSTINLPPPLPVDESAKKRRLLLITSGIVGSIVIVTLVATITALVVSQRQMPPDAPPAPLPEAAPPLPRPSSKFATNAAVLQIQKNARNTLGKIDSADLSEPEIAPPVLDLRLNISPQI